jgi:malate permease and related proteins
MLLNTAPIIQKTALICLYMLVGYILKKKFKFKNIYFANLLLYVLIPITVFKSTSQYDVMSFISNVSMGFGLNIVMFILAYASKRLFKDIPSNVIYCLFSYLNVGWFGIPIAYIFFGELGASIMTGFFFGSGILYGNTVGYLLATNTEIKPIIIIKKLEKIPALYAAAIGIIVHALGLHKYFTSNNIVQSFFEINTSLLSLFGMGLVGMSIVGSASTVNIKSVVYVLLARLLALIIAVYIMLYGLGHFGLINATEASLLKLYICLPIAANVLVFAYHGKQKTDVIGMSLFLSTIVSCAMVLGYAFV